MPNISLPKLGNTYFVVKVCLLSAILEFKPSGKLNCSGSGEDQLEQEKHKPKLVYQVYPLRGNDVN